MVLKDLSMFSAELDGPHHGRALFHISDIKRMLLNYLEIKIWCWIHVDKWSIFCHIILFKSAHFDFYGIFRLQEVKSHLVQPRIKTPNPTGDTWFNMKPVKRKPNSLHVLDESFAKEVWSSIFIHTYTNTHTLVFVSSTERRF